MIDLEFVPNNAKLFPNRNKLHPNQSLLIMSLYTDMDNIIKISIKQVINTNHSV